MAGRRLSADEAALWSRVIAGIRPLEGARTMLPPVAAKAISVQLPSPAAPPPRPSLIAPPRADTLDGTWDKRLARGLVAPDRIVDLHGHTLASAHALLDSALDRAIRDGDRLLLLVTGKPPRPASERPHARGAIRAAVGDWLVASGHAQAIAAIRGAHPRHGGAGALYIVLRRRRSGGNR